MQVINELEIKWKTIGRLIFCFFLEKLHFPFSNLYLFIYLVRLRLFYLILFQLYILMLICRLILITKWDSFIPYNRFIHIFVFDPCFYYKSLFPYTLISFDWKSFSTWNWIAVFLLRLSVYLNRAGLPVYSTYRSSCQSQRAIIRSESQPKLDGDQTALHSFNWMQIEEMRLWSMAGLCNPQPLIILFVVFLILSSGNVKSWIDRRVQCSHKFHFL